LVLRRPWLRSILSVRQHLWHLWSLLILSALLLLWLRLIPWRRLNLWDHLIPSVLCFLSGLLYPSDL
jgi:hypothetical protein